MKKTVQYGKRIVDLDFRKNSINISIWYKDDNLPTGFGYITEFDVKTGGKND